MTAGHDENSDTPIRPPDGYDEICSLFGDPARNLTAIGEPTPSWQTRHLAIVQLPFSLPLGWCPTVQVRRLRCHRKLVNRFRGVFDTILAEGLRTELRTFDGCYCFRLMRSSRRLSTHSWGIAIDLNAATNRPGSHGDIHRDIVAIFREYGFSWGGKWRRHRRDPMHFQFCTWY